MVSQFFQLDRLVVEGGKTGKESGSNNIRREKVTGYVSRHQFNLEDGDEFNARTLLHLL